MSKEHARGAAGGEPDEQRSRDGLACRARDRERALRLHDRFVVPGIGSDKGPVRLLACASLGKLKLARAVAPIVGLLALRVRRRRHLQLHRNGQ